MVALIAGCRPETERSIEPAACLPECISTTTTVSILEGTTFTGGDTITLQAVVDPTPDGGRVFFYATNPTYGSGIPVVDVVDGAATTDFICGSNRVPFGEHVAQVQYRGTDAYEESVSSTIAYECLEGGS